MIAHRLTRREFTAAIVGGVGVGALPVLAADKPKEKEWPFPLEREVGITTSSLSGHLSLNGDRGKFTLLELPQILRDELGMRVIDLNTSGIASHDSAYLDRVRKAVSDAGCVLTNLKLNQRGLDMNHKDPAIRKRAMKAYKQSIDDASRLGIAWARPLPLKDRPDMDRHVAAYRELVDYAAERDVKMLVENYQWMESDPRSVVKLIEAIDRDVKASPDIGNWAPDVRYEGLKHTFPLAVTCDFKARALGANGEHKLYDLKRCFQIGWQAGFRGPWCLEHANRDRKALFRELRQLRDMLKAWMKDAATKPAE